MLGKFVKFNRNVFDIILWAVVYSQFMLPAIFIYGCYYSLLGVQFHWTILLTFVIFYLMLYGYTLVVIFFSPFLFLNLNILFILFLGINKLFFDKPRILIKKLVVALDKLKKKYDNKYVSYYLLTAFSFFVFLLLGLYLPLWLYERIFGTPASFAPRDAIRDVLNYKAFVIGLIGYIVVLFINYILKLLFKKQIPIFVNFKEL